MKKEKSIIIEELKMYRDDPKDRLSAALMKSMYADHRLRADICGSISSVKSITPEDLYTAYESFYIPSNMVLCLCGRFEKAAVEKILDKTLPQRPKKMPKMQPLKEESIPERCLKTRGTIHLDVSLPSVAIGIKAQPFFENTDSHLKTFHAMSVLAQALFGVSGEFVSGLIKDRLTTDIPSFEIVHTKDFSHILFETLTHDPKEVIKRFDRCAEKIRKNGIVPSDISLYKKMLYADLLDSFNSCEECAHFYLSDLMEHIHTSRTIDCITSLSEQDVNECAEKLLEKDRICRLSVFPASAKKGATL